MNTRKYFGTDGIRGEVGRSVINAEFALRLGYAAGRVLAAKHPSRGRPAVLIGKDPRLSGYMLESAMEAGLSAAGIDVFLAGPLYAGFFLVANKISRNVEVTYPDFFMGFQYYMPVMLVWVIGQVIAGLGLLLVLPGIYLMVGYMFAVLISIFGGFDFWNSLEYSRKLIHIRWWKFFLLALCLVILNIIGAMLLIVGLIVTIPLTFYVIYCLFEEVTQETLVE